MQWNAGYSESVHTFANTINTHEGGTHEEHSRGVGRAWSTSMPSTRKWPKEKDPNLTGGNDIREGLALKVAEPSSRVRP